MPVFYFCRNIDAVAWLHFYSFFAFFLIISSSGNAYQNLSTSTFCMMVTLKLLEDMGIRYFVIGKDTTEEEVSAAMQEFRKELDRGEDVAFVIRKGALSYEEKVEYRNDNPMIREEIIRHIVQASGEDPIVSTTGKASRELFEIREHNGPTFAAFWAGE